MTDSVEEKAAVVVAYLHSNEVSSSWHHSIVQMLAHDLEHDLRVMRGGWIAMRSSAAELVDARNKAVETFLEEKNAEWLFWVDTDMGFAADTVDRLLEVAHPVSRPVVGALCYSQREVGPDGYGGYRTAATPTIFDWVSEEDQMGFAVRWDYRENALVRCAGTGSACVLIHRSVFEKVLAAHGPTWYDRVPNTTTGQRIGEDLSFCLRLGALNIPVYVHTGVEASHHKGVWLAQEDYRRERWLTAPQPPPAQEAVAVLVPVLGRSQNAAPFVASLRASTGLATAYALVGPDEHGKAQTAVAAAWRRAGAQVMHVGGLTFAEKVNRGLKRTHEPWIFLTGDDVHFRAGWLDYAQAVAGDRFHVVGTNDLGNPRVKSGEHATHMLIRRSYIEELGASWDGPGVVAHEGYRHWFVDDEIVTVAKQRGVWVPALASIVEHMHPMWEKGEMDDTYKLGRRSAAADKKVFEKRCEQYLLSA